MNAGHMVTSLYQFLLHKVLFLCWLVFQVIVSLGISLTCEAY